MIRAMHSGVTGLKSHQVKMDVIGNNVANVNTVGFKSSRVLFSEIFNEMVSSARTPMQARDRGGTNPMQVGVGIDISSIDKNMAKGSVERTDNVMDLSIDGEGFFVTGAIEEGEHLFTRAGNFSIDQNGNLVTGNGMKVFGWNEYTIHPEHGVQFDTDQDIKPINIYIDEQNGNKKVVSSNATERVSLSGNLNAGVEALGEDVTDDTEQAPHYTSPFTVYDSLGNNYRLNVEYFKVEVTDEHTEWQIRAKSIIDGEEEGYETIVDPEVLEASIYFDKDGTIKEESVTDPVLSIKPGLLKGAQDMNIALDLSQLTMYDGESTVRPDFLDGNKMGNLNSFSFGEDGVITGVYDNGERMPLGQIALVNFNNPQGLIKVGNNSFAESANSGGFFGAVAPGEGGTGEVSPGTLEMSNIDLSREFADMIITQRGFQANSRTVTSADEMLQELINIKR